MKKIISQLTLAAAMFLPLLLSAQVESNVSALEKGIIVQPSMIDFNLAAGQVGNRKLKLDNRTAQPVQLKMYLNDWERDENGKHKYYLPGAMSASCASWISLDSSLLEIPPGGTTFLTVNMKLPDSSEAAEEMKWAMLFVEVVKEKKVIQDTGVNSGIIPTFRMGIHIYQTPPTVTKKEMKMISFDREKMQGDTIIYKVGVQNQGAVQLKCKGAFELTNLATGEKIRIGPVQVPLFPGQKRYLYYTMPKSLPKGKYSLLTILDAGDDLPVEAAQGELEIK